MTTWHPVDEWPGNFSFRWLANESINGVTVVLAMCTPAGEWVSGYEPSPTRYTRPVAWAKIEYPQPPVHVPARWADPNEVDP